MKTFKLAALALFVAGSVTFALAGPGPQYWQSRTAPAKATPVSPTTASHQPAAAPCSCQASCHR